MEGKGLPEKPEKVLPEIYTARLRQLLEELERHKKEVAKVFAAAEGQIQECFVGGLYSAGKRELPHQDWLDEANDATEAVGRALVQLGQVGEHMVRFARGGRRRR